MAVPWREVWLAAGLLLLGTWAFLAAVGVPFVLFLAGLASGARRLPPLILAAALASLLVARAPHDTLFVVAAVLSATAGVLALRAWPRVGYAELSVCVLAGTLAALAAWVAAGPEILAAYRRALEVELLEQARSATARLVETGAVDASDRALLEIVLEDLARLFARLWPAGLFGILWLGSGPALAFAARAARPWKGRTRPSGEPAVANRWARPGGEAASANEQAQPDTGPASPAERDVAGTDAAHPAHAAARPGDTAARPRNGAARVTVSENCGRFRLPDLWVWVLLAGMAVFLAAPRGAVQDAGLNVAVVAGGLYAWQGLAIALYYLERRNMRLAARVLLLGAMLVLAPWLVLVLALCVGLADVWLDLRSRRRGNPPPAHGV